MAWELSKTPRGSWVVNHDSESILSLRRLVGPTNVDLYRTFVGAYLSFLADSPVDTTKPTPLVRRFAAKLLNTKPKELIVWYSSLADRILLTCNMSSDYSTTGEFLDEMKDTPIFREYLHFYRTGDPVCLQFILSFLYFGKKMDYEDIDLQSTAFRKWIEIEQELERGRVYNDNIIRNLRSIVRKLLGTFSDDIFLPKHGPGYTSEGALDVNDKLDQLSFDPLSQYAFRPESFGRFGMQRTALDYFGNREVKIQVAKLRFVPKNVKTMRSICMEPISRMYLQQEVSRWLIHSMETGRIHRNVTLRDQTNNQRYAVAGSYTYSCDTIDLSSASDSVDWELVKRIFPPKVLYYLMATRTRYVRLPDGTQHTMKKYAPMGSALCFPIQCIVFTSIVYLAANMTAKGIKIVDFTTEGEGHVLDNVNIFKNYDPEQVLPDLLNPTIYGDDIICDSRITDNVLNLLAHLGFTVNAEKSYFGGQMFRESCGIFAYNGEDVTPQLFRLPNGRRNASYLSSCIDMANRCGDRRYFHLRSYIINHLKALRIDGIKMADFLPFCTDRSQYGIFTTRPAYWHVRWNKYLHRWEKKSAGVRSVKSRRALSSLSGEYHYDQWMRARVNGGSPEWITPASLARPLATRVKLGWTPV